MTLSGFTITDEEWDTLGEELLHAFVDTGPIRADEGAYESYELIWDEADDVAA